MYIVSRNLVTLHSGNCIRKLCGSGSKSVKRFLPSPLGNASSTVHQTTLKRTYFALSSSQRKETSVGLRNVTPNGVCPCYSQSAEKAVPKEDGEAEQLSEGRKENFEAISSSSSEESIVNDEDIQEDNDEDDGIYLSEEQIQQLSGGDPELIKKIRYIQLEYSVMRQEGNQVPSLVKFKYWKELLYLDSRSKRKKFYLFLFKTEMKQLSVERRKEIKREERLKMFAENPLPSREEDIYGMVYGLSRNCIFLRLYDTTVNKFFHCRAASAMMHHPPLVIDCSYDEHMNRREAKNCAKQIELLIGENRTHREPYNLYLCNAGRNTNTVEYLDRLIPTIRDDDYALNFHEESFMELFPKERLVYLTPHTRDELEEYNEDDIYIIGAMVDKTDPKPYSLAKAKKLGIKMRRLPLDQHLMWGLGGKSLTLNQMVRIMLDLRYSRGDWKAALKHVPMRKLCRDYHPYPNQENEQQDQPDTSPISQPSRKEKKSHVMEDYELLNSRRKGFRRSQSYSSNSSAPPRRSSQAVQAPRIKSLFSDD